MHALRCQMLLSVNRSMYMSLDERDVRTRGIRDSVGRLRLRSAV